MAPLTPEQRRTRDRVERLIRLMAPGLDLVLAAGERLSRIVEPDDYEYYPIRSSLPAGEEQPKRERAERS
jgi:hypothetical protein